jgi:hypothetical protein
MRRGDWPRALRSSASRQRAQKPGLTHVVAPQVAHDEDEARRRSTIAKCSETRERQLVPIRSDSPAQNSRRSTMLSGLSSPAGSDRKVIVRRSKANGPGRELRRAGAFRFGCG